MMRHIFVVVAFLFTSQVLAQDVINPQTNASALISGTVAAARGGAGTINGALKGNGSGAVSQAACADLSNGTATCSAAAGQLPATATNDSAAAGFVGQVIESTVLVAGQVSITANTATNITSVSLTAGDWDCAGNVVFNPNAATTVTNLGAWISSTSAALPTAPNSGGEIFLGLVYTTGGQQILPVGRMRFLLSGTTTVYIQGYATFAVNVMNGFGYLGCRRAR